MKRRAIGCLVAAAVVMAGCGGTTSVRSTATTAPVTSTPTVATAPPVTITGATTLNTAPAPPEPVVPSHLRPGVPVVSAGRYLRDTQLAFRALRLFSTTLQGIDDPGEFSSRLTLLRAELRIFDAAIRRLRRYQLESKTLDAQRSRLGRQGPPLARSMSGFLDAVRDGNRSRATSLAAEVQRRLTALRSAAGRN